MSESRFTREFIICSVNSNMRVIPLNLFTQEFILESKRRNPTIYSWMIDKNVRMSIHTGVHHLFSEFKYESDSFKSIHTGIHTGE
jgi:hypothetical protein